MIEVVSSNLPPQRQLKVENAACCRLPEEQQATAAGCAGSTATMCWAGSLHPSEDPAGRGAAMKQVDCFEQRTQQTVLQVQNAVWCRLVVGQAAVAGDAGSTAKQGCAGLLLYRT